MGSYYFLSCVFSLWFSLYTLWFHRFNHSHAEKTVSRESRLYLCDSIFTSCHHLALSSCWRGHFVGQECFCTGFLPCYIFAYFIFRYLNFYFICVSGLAACMCVSCECLVPWRSEDSRSWKLEYGWREHHAGLGTEPSSSTTAAIVIAAEPSLQYHLT